MAKTKVKEEGPTANELLEQELAAVGLSDSLQLVDFYPTAHVCFTKSGLPSLDSLLTLHSLGLAEGRDVEIYSRDGSAGKTSICLQILAFWQSLGKKCAIADPEGTITETFANSLGVITDPKKCPPGIYPVRMIAHRRDLKTGRMIRLSLEEIFDTIQKASDIFDIIVVDSVDALMEKSQADKTAEEHQKQGGIAKPLGELLRKNVAKKATVLWINQTRQSMGYNPTGNVTYVTTGGRAMRFYSSIRIELSVVEKLSEGDKDPYGFVVKVNLVKNKLGPPWRSVQLVYIFGEGFSITYDYMKIALKNKIITKSGSWFTSDVLAIKCQGEKKLYDLLKANQNGSLDKLKSLVDGEDVEVGEVDPELKQFEAELEAADKD